MGGDCEVALGVSAGVRRSDAHGWCFDGRVALECGDQPRGLAGAQGEWHLVVPAAHLSEVFVQDLGICF